LDALDEAVGGRVGALVLASAAVRAERRILHSGDHDVPLSFSAAAGPDDVVAPSLRFRFARGHPSHSLAPSARSPPSRAQLACGSCDPRRSVAPSPRAPRSLKIRTGPLAPSELQHRGSLPLA